MCNKTHLFCDGCEPRRMAAISNLSTSFTHRKMNQVRLVISIFKAMTNVILVYMYIPIYVCICIWLRESKRKAFILKARRWWSLTNVLKTTMNGIITCRILLAPNDYSTIRWTMSSLHSCIGFQDLGHNSIRIVFLSFLFEGYIMILNLI